MSEQQPPAGSNPQLPPNLPPAHAAALNEALNGGPLPPGVRIETNAAPQPTHGERIINDAPAVGGIVVGAVLGAAHLAKGVLPEGSPLHTIAEGITNIPYLGSAPAPYAVAGAGLAASKALWVNWKKKHSN